MGLEAPTPVRAALDVQLKAHTEPVVKPNPTAPQPPSEDAPAPTLLLSSDLVVEVDAAAGRFVQKFLDRDTEDVRLQWPSERQLAFSRGVRAYLAAQKI